MKSVITILTFAFCTLALRAQSIPTNCKLTLDDNAITDSISINVLRNTQEIKCKCNSVFAADSEYFLEIKSYQLEVALPNDGGAMSAKIIGSSFAIFKTINTNHKVLSGSMVVLSEVKTKDAEGDPLLISRVFFFVKD